MPQSVFALRTSVFNDFLYAPVGEEGNGMVLTTLSALARIGVDPWDEAARLSELPTETATKRLASVISGIPHSQWPESSVGDIVARLIALLPGKQAAVVQQPATVHAKRVPPAAIAMVLFIFLVNALAFTALRNHETAADQSAAASPTAASPQTPLP
ncbi:MAG TPA: hypothetical protein VGP48_08875 [Stellaceae bacterium]|nr:hypothetical protein [Stellaceae bacterium]